jgi:two-component system chemotaxis response regulator CheB
MSMVRVLVVEDSLVERTLMVSLLGADPEIEVLGAVPNGVAALAFLEHQRPDIITMDTTLPDGSGYETTRRIMETTPVPILLMGEHWSGEEQQESRAVDAGAIAELQKPPGMNSPGYEEATRRFVQTVKAMAEVKVVRRWGRHPQWRNGRSLQGHAATPETACAQGRSPLHLVAVGSSTGGPAVLKTLLAHLRKDFAPPVVIAQHIAPGFLDGLTKWLGQTTGHTVQIAAQRERLEPGRIYLAPDGLHMGVEPPGVIVLRKDALEHGMRPAVSYLFRSVMSTFGKSAAGVLLTGMGRDGADELKQMRDSGALTIAQDQATSVVFGMPGEAVKLGAAMYVLPPEKIAALLNETMDGPPAASRGGADEKASPGV